MNELSDSDLSHVKLVFCNPKVDPDEVSRVLGVMPTAFLRVGQEFKYDHLDQMSISQVGKWEMSFNENTIELALLALITLLRGRADGLEQLCNAGYEPYVDCRLGVKFADAYFEDSLLKDLAAFGVGLSVWH